MLSKIQITYYKGIPVSTVCFTCIGPPAPHTFSRWIQTIDFTGGGGGCNHYFFLFSSLVHLNWLVSNPRFLSQLLLRPSFLTYVNCMVLYFQHFTCLQRFPGVYFKVDFPCSTWIIFNCMNFNLLIDTENPRGGE